MDEMHYPNAPIIEAIVDIRARAAKSTDEATFTTFAEALQDSYAQAVPLYAHQLTFDTSHPEQMEATGERTGIRLIRNDGKCQVVANKEGFAFSLLAPYTRWSEFIEAALPVWTNYLTHLKPETFSRVALRYVNLFRFTDSSVSLPRYFTVYPQVEAIDSMFSQHQLRVRMKLDETTAAIVTQAHLPASDEVHILLDLDVFKERDLPADAAGIWECLNPLRDHKNWVFRQCLTFEGEQRIRK